MPSGGLIAAAAIYRTFTVLQGFNALRRANCGAARRRIAMAFDVSMPSGGLIAAGKHDVSLRCTGVSMPSGGLIAAALRHTVRAG